MLNNVMNHSLGEISETLMPTLPSNWPHSGKIEFSNVILRYLENEAPALNNISFTIAPQSHVAIVGRTGSGKSSIFACLLRKCLNFKMSLMSPISDCI